MKIIGAGQARTGTASLREALIQLGYGPCYHMIEVMKSQERIAFWQRVAAGEQVNWLKHFSDFNSGVDVPPSLYYKELMAAYPDAKIILTVRDDAERWYDSMFDGLFFSNSITNGWRRYVIPPYTRYTDMVKAVLWNGFFEGRFAEKDYAMTAYEKHNAEVIAYVPADRLLVFNVKEGWGPLCKFLDAPVPAGVPFPHTNDRRMVKAMQVILNFLMFAIPFGLLGILTWLVGLFF
jgi:hypothetical protein